MGKRETTKRRRAKGTGCLLLRGNVWYAKWTRNGIRRVESTGIHVGDTRTTDGRRVLTDREMAEEWLMDRTEPLRMRHRADALALLARQLQTAQERMADRIENARHVMTVGELYADFERSARRPDCSETMLTFYRRKIEHFAEFVGKDTPVTDITVDTAGKYASHIGKTYAANSFNKAINAIALVWKCCALHAGVREEDSPWTDRYITRRRSDTHVKAGLSEAEADRVMLAAKGEMRILFAIGLSTGLRLGDAVHVRWEDFRGDEIFVKTRKTGARVAIPLLARLQEAVGERQKRGFLVPGLAAIYDDRKRRTHVTRLTKRVLDDCKIETSVSIKGKRARSHAGFHSCRVYFVTKALEAGVPLAIVQGIVGHANVAMTEHYFRVESDAVLEAFRRMK